VSAANREFIAELDAAIGCQQCGCPLGDSPSADFCSPRCQTAWSAARAKPLTSYTEPDEQPAHVSNLVELHSPETCVACVEGRSHGLRPPWLHGPWAMDALRVAARRQRAESFRRLYLNATTHVDAPADADGSLYANRLAEALRRDAQRIGAAFGALAEHTNEPCRVEPIIDEATWTAVRSEQPAPDSPNWRDFGHVRDGFAIGIDPATRDGGGSMVALTRRDGVDYVEAVLSPGLVVFPPEFGERMREVNEQIGRAWAAAWHDFGPIVDEAYRAVQPVIESMEEQSPTDPRERALWLRQHRNTGPSASTRAPRTINPRRAR
jgi:hypothetical protein